MRRPSRGGSTGSSTDLAVEARHAVPREVHLALLRCRVEARCAFVLLCVGVLSGGTRSDGLHGVGVAARVMLVGTDRSRELHTNELVAPC